MSRAPTDYLELLEKTLGYARQQEYRGYDKADGMSSRFRQWLPVESKWMNIAFQESAKRAPINLRPLLLIEQRRNFKGMALFASANISMWNLTDDEQYECEAIECLDWLLENRSSGYAGFCGGHQHDVQGLDAKTPARTPGVVGTSYAVQALLRGTALNGCYGETARTAPAYVFDDLDYHEIDAGARINYKPSTSSDYYTLNANALGARLLLDVYADTGTERYCDAGQKILEYVASHQTDDGGWMYRDPPNSSHLSKDNYHNGFIIESFLRYQEIVDENAFTDTIDNALDFYKSVLYEDNGAPCWDENSKYPRDVHAAAQGIVTFTHAGDLEFVRRIIDWTIKNLYAGEGQFYYQKQKWYTKRFTLMRWCQAWMAYALSEYLKNMNTGD